MDLCTFSETEIINGKDSALDFSVKKAPLEEYAFESSATSTKSSATTSDPMKLWYTVNTDPRSAKKIALESLSYASIDQSVYIMLQVDCSFADKFEYINIKELVHTNLRNGMTLMELSDCLRMIAKYAKELLKPSGERYKNWNKIPFLKSGSPQKWTRMEGTASILHQLGYTQGTSKGYVFPLTSYGPSLALIKVIALELAMSAAELSVFYNNRHPKAEVITSMLQVQRDEPSCSKQPTSASTSWKPFNVMDFLGSSLETNREQLETNSMRAKPERDSLSSSDDPKDVTESLPKRRRSYETIHPDDLSSFAHPQSSAKDPQTLSEIQRAQESSRAIIPSLSTQFDSMHSLNFLPKLEGRHELSSFDMASPTEIQNLSNVYNEQLRSQSVTNWESDRRNSLKVPITLPDLSIITNVFNSPEQKYNDQF